MLPNNDQFQELLLNYSQETNPEARKKLEDTIWKNYGTENTVLALDMFGFSLLTRKYGIIHYLSMIRRMQLTVEPIIVGHGGRVIKFEADNCFALLPNPLSAARAAIPHPAHGHARISQRLRPLVLRTGVQPFGRQHNRRRCRPKRGRSRRLFARL